MVGLSHTRGAPRESRQVKHLLFPAVDGVRVECHGHRVDSTREVLSITHGVP